MTAKKEKFLSREDVFSELELKTEVVQLGKGNVIVSELGATDYLAMWTEDVNNDDGTVNMAKLVPKLLAYSIVDESGNRLFAEDDIERLSRAAQGPFMKIAAVAKRLNGLSGDEAKN